MIQQPLLPLKGWNYVRKLNLGYLRFGPQTWAIGVLAVGLLSALVAAPLLTAACILVLPVGATLLWREGEPPILFAVFFMQWLQVSTGVFQADFAGLSVEDSFGVPGVVTATWLSLLGLLVLAAGIRLALRSIGPSQFATLLAEVHRYRLRRVEQAYLGAILAALALGFFVWIIPGLSQLLLALTSLRWVFFFVLVVTVMVKRRGYSVLALAFGFELLDGFTSFFSDYKTVFFIFALAFFTARPRVTGRMIVYAFSILGVVLTLSAFWSVVKMDYRDYVSGGTGQQVVLVSPLEQLDKLGELVGNAGFAALPEGFERLTDRVQYTEYFGRVVDRIPSRYPHEDGMLWGAALRHVLMPRLLFPDKAALTADVLNTERYTGLNMIEQQGRDTEVPLGYMAESYIDFGKFGMFIPIGLLGLLYGLMYRYFVSRPRYLLFAYGAAAAMLRVAGSYETTAVKLLGGGLTAFAAMYLAFRFMVPKVHRWLTLTARRPIVV